MQEFQCALEEIQQGVRHGQLLFSTQFNFTHFTSELEPHIEVTALSAVRVYGRLTGEALGRRGYVVDLILSNTLLNSSQNRCVSKFKFKLPC